MGWSTVITALKTERGLALQDLITGAYEHLDTIEFKPHVRAYLLDALATTEYVLSYLFHSHTLHPMASYLDLITNLSLSRLRFNAP
jgi:hypothetical protein